MLNLNKKSKCFISDKPICSAHQHSAHKKQVVDLLRVNFEYQRQFPFIVLDTLWVAGFSCDKFKLLFNLEYPGVLALLDILLDRE